ncbi:hypothetical protein D3C80_1385680 [compost metagenome]
MQIGVAGPALRRELADVGLVEAGRIGEAAVQDNSRRALGHAVDGASTQQGLAVDVVVRAVRTGDHRGVDLLEVGRSEALCPGTPNAEAVDDVPGCGDLGFGHVAEVRIVLEPTRHLNFQIVDQRDVHFRRDQGGGELQICGEDVALPVGVRVFRRVDQVAVGRA